VRFSGAVREHDLPHANRQIRRSIFQPRLWLGALGGAWEVLSFGRLEKVTALGGTSGSTVSVMWGDGQPATISLPRAGAQAARGIHLGRPWRDQDGDPRSGGMNWALYQCGNTVQPFGRLQRFFFFPKKKRGGGIPPRKRIAIPRSVSGARTAIKAALDPKDHEPRRDVPRGRAVNLGRRPGPVECAKRG